MRVFHMTVAVLIASLGLATASPAPEHSFPPKPRPEGLNLQAVKATPSNLAFARWIEGFQARARSQGIRPSTLEAAFQGVRYNSDVIARDRNQAEFTKTLGAYLESAVSATRVKNGRAALRKHRRVLDQIEARYGVEAEVVAAIWGMESAYGEYRGDMPLIESLATLAFDGRRGRFFEGQLIAALKILQSGDVSPRKMTGSWAGAMGHTQFIPTSYLAYAADFRGDGKRDIWSDDPTDALASTASYLARFGWKKGQPWGVEVRLPRGFNYGLAGSATKKSPADWAALGVRDVGGERVPNYGRASIVVPAGADGPAFMIFDNFKVITRYNNSDAYVLGVGHLSDRIGGAGPLKAKWPAETRSLTRAERIELQRRLTRAGFDTAGADGIIGPRTIRALKAYQRSVGLTPDGYPSQKILKRLR